MIVKKTIIVICTFLFFYPLNSQSSDIMELDPQIIAAADCNGMILGNSLVNYESGILSEERARIMARTASLSFFLTAIKYQNIDHIRTYQEEYQMILQDAVNYIYNLVVAESFDWDTQAELDVCSARIFDPLTSVTKSELDNAGIEDYFEFIRLLGIESDNVFDFFLSIQDAMR